MKIVFKQFEEIEGQLLGGFVSALAQADSIKVCSFTKDADTEIQIELLKRKELGTPLMRKHLVERHEASES